MAEWYDEASKYRGKNGSPNLGSGQEHVYGVPVNRPYIVTPNGHEFRDRWVPASRGAKSDHKLPPSSKKK